MNSTDKITIAHGSGGKITNALIRDVFFKHLNNSILLEADDSAIIDVETKRLAFTTDSFVVKPIFFPGGDIGKIAACGTINDLAVSGASPKYITCGFIIEEGFSLTRLEKIVISLAGVVKKSGVKVVSGDIKVVGKGQTDGIFINTSGIGTMPQGKNFGVDKIKPGDKVIISGTVGDHEIAILSKRKGLEFESEIESDCAPLNKMLEEVVKSSSGVRFMRDPTRGGLATTLNEIVQNKNFGILIEEEKIPISKQVKGACELLGLDPLYLANEGKAIIIVSPEDEQKVLSVLKKNEYGKNAASIGEITTAHPNKVCLKTLLGITRIVDMLTAEQLPRIC